MEAIEAAPVGLAQHPVNLGSEAVTRRRLIAGVDLEILRDRINPVAEDLQQLRVGRLGRHDAPRQEHDTMPSTTEAMLSRLHHAS